jgi:hypothetical protein
VEAAPPEMIRGMWVWPSSAFATAEARERLLRFCDQHGFNRLDVHLGMRREGARSFLKTPEELQALLCGASERGVTVAALRGDSRMFFARNHARALQDLEALIEFNLRQPDDARLVGLKYDVEPYLLDEWRAGGESRLKVVGDYLEGLAKVRRLLAEKSPEMTLAVDIPFWWDKEELTVEFGGKRQRLHAHVQDLTDYVALMSYQTKASTVQRYVAEETAYAARVGKFILAGLNTRKLTKDAHTSFHGRPVEEFRAVKADLERSFKGRPGAGGLMIHHYGSLLEYLGEPGAP